MGLMIKKILVPTDFSDLTKSAMSYAIRIARVFGAEIHILHVVEGYEHNVLKGLEAKLSIVSLVMFEHHYDDMLKKDYTFRDIHRLLINNNFKQIYKYKMSFRKTFEYILLLGFLIARVIASLKSKVVFIFFLFLYSVILFAIDLDLPSSP